MHVAKVRPYKDREYTYSVLLRQTYREDARSSIGRSPT